MRVLLVGSEVERVRLRKVLEERNVEVIGEVETMSEVSTSGLEADATVLAGAPRNAAPPEKLTPREHDVLELLALGFSNKRIAARLEISEHTVKFHVAAICGKLGAENRTDAVRRALLQGLVAL